MGVIIRAKRDITLIFKSLKIYFTPCFSVVRIVVKLFVIVNSAKDHNGVPSLITILCSNVFTEICIKKTLALIALTTNLKTDKTIAVIIVIARYKIIRL